MSILAPPRRSSHLPLVKCGMERFMQKRLLHLSELDTWMLDEASDTEKWHKANQGTNGTPLNKPISRLVHGPTGSLARTGTQWVPLPAKRSSRREGHEPVKGILMEIDTIQVMKHSAGEPRFLLQWQVFQKASEKEGKREWHWVKVRRTRFTGFARQPPLRSN